MVSISTFYLLFSKHGKFEEKVSENFSDYSLDIQTKDPHKMKLEDLKGLIETIPTKDKINLFIKVDGGSEGVYDLRKSESSTASINTIIKEYLEDDEPHNFTFKLAIKKSTDDGYIPVYSLSNFLLYLKKLSLSDLCKHFSKAINKKLIFYLVDDYDYLLTDCIVFTHNIKDLNIANGIDREVIIEKSLEIANQSGENIYKVIPSDFYLKIKPNNKELGLLFNRVCLQLCYIYLSNITQIYNDKVTYRIIGYKPIGGSIPNNILSIEDESVKMYFSIQQWVYSDGSISDKCGLARNILSLYITQDNYNNIHENLFSYILSCNELYMRENVDKYIEVKSNVVNLLNDINTKYMDAIDSFSGKIRNNLVGIISFYFTTLVLNTLSQGKISNIFTKDIAVISYVFLGGSFCYLLLSLFDYHKKAERYKDYYYRQKKLYGDILVQGDIEELFLKDEPFDKDRGSIFWTGVRYSILWVVISIILLYAVGYLSGYRITQIIFSK